jgi:hypothetical protein
MKEPFELFGYEVGEGWMPIVRKAVDELQAKGAVITQVIEKFGGLRIYFDTPPGSMDIWDSLHKIVEDAEIACAAICQECGEPGELRHGGWIRTLCDKHEKEYQDSMNERNLRRRDNNLPKG